MTALRIKTIADHGYTDASANPSKFPAGLFSICTGSYDSARRSARSTPPTPTSRRAASPTAAPSGSPRRYTPSSGSPTSWRTSSSMDPAELRMKNFIPPEQFPYQSVARLGVRQRQLPGRAEAGHGRDRLRRAAQGAGGEAHAAASSWASESPASPRSSAPGPSKDFDILGLKMFDSAEIRVHPTGKAIARFGTKSQGQGHETTYAQIVAEELGIPAAQRPGRGGRHRHRALRPRHLREPLDADRRRRRSRGSAQDPRQGAEDRRAPPRGVRGGPRLGDRQVLGEGRPAAVEDDPGDRASPPTPTIRRAWRRVSRRSTTTTPRTSPSRSGATSASSTSTAGRAR